MNIKKVENKKYRYSRQTVTRYRYLCHTVKVDGKPVPVVIADLSIIPDTLFKEWEKALVKWKKKNPGYEKYSDFTERVRQYHLKRKRRKK